MKLYPETKALIITLFLFFVSLFLLKYTKAYFSDTEKLLGNSIEVGVWDIAPSPSEPTNTPIPTEEPPEVTNTPIPTPTATNTPTPTPSNLADHIVISEVQITEGAGKTTHDFIELYNPTNNSINLKGHRLVKRTGNSPSDTSIKSWTSDTFIPAHSFYLWASSDDSSYPTTIGANTSTTSILGEENSIALRQGPEDTGTLIDVLSWNNGSTLVEGDEFDPDPGPGQSMERKAYSTSDTTSMMTGSDVTKGNAYDSNNNANDFILRTTSQPQNSSSPIEIP